MADAPVLDVPRGNTASHEIGRQRVHQIEAVDLAPEPTVDEDDEGRGLAGRQPQVPELTLAVAVGDAPPLDHSINCGGTLSFTQASTSVSGCTTSAVTPADTERVGWALMFSSV